MRRDLDKYTVEELKAFYYDCLEDLRIHTEAIWNEVDHGRKDDDSLELIFRMVSEVQLRVQDLFILGVTIRLQDASNELQKGT